MTPVLSGLPYDMPVRFARESLAMTDDVGKPWSEFGSAPSDESLAHLLCEAVEPEKTARIVCSRPSLWQQGFDFVLGRGLRCERGGSGSIGNYRHAWEGLRLH